MSGALDVATLRARPSRVGPSGLDRIFGDGEIAAEDDLLALVRRAEPAGLPALYQCCGTEDELINDNVVFRDACAAAGIALTTQFHPGAHEWSYWDARIQDVLGWLPIHRAQ
jgi:S-formylglutathione hydrolase FrmB